MANPLMNLYMEFTGGTEQPAQFRRWSLLSVVNAALGKRNYFQKGRLRYYPNQYVLLSGLPATRKTSAINQSGKLLRQAGYKAFAPESTSREKFLEDLQVGFGITNRPTDEDIMELFSTLPLDESPCYISSGELLDFLGMGNLAFLTTLTNMWDVRDIPYEDRLKKSASIYIRHPIINLIGGTTPDNLKAMMPQQILGHGFMTRLILVHSDPVVNKITFPEDEDPVVEQRLVEHLKKIMEMKGVFTGTEKGLALLDKIYQSFTPLPDSRLQAYCGRRLDHLIKLCIACAACRLTYKIDEEIVEEANTILAYTEETMSQALGQLGESRNAKAIQYLLNVLGNNTSGPMSIQDLYKSVQHDFTRYAEFLEVMVNLEKGDRIESSNKSGTMYYLLKRSHEVNGIGINKSKWLEEFQS